jgi:hypothetical protein
MEDCFGPLAEEFAMGGEDKTSSDWDKHEWAGKEVPAGESDATTHWNEGQWAGQGPVDVAADQTSDTGPSGGGHNPGGQHWSEEEEVAEEEQPA